MKHALSILLAVGAVSGQTVLIEPYGQCGGLSWQGPWECESGYTCSPVGTDAFPDYQCYPNVGPIVAHAFPYAQCGGQGFIGPTVCSHGWTCVVLNAFFSQCVENANTTTPADPTPNLASPGGFCGESAVERSSPIDCVPGFTCSGPGVYGYYVCLLNTSSSSSTATTTTTALTTVAISTTSSTTAVFTTIAISTTKSTTSRKSSTSTTVSISTTPSTSKTSSTTRVCS